ncbi:TLC domain-containing protein [Flammula alnicola]|nr:TLC domain-containing protein [Flammula alnicola]
MSASKEKANKLPISFRVKANGFEEDRNHHLTVPFLPQTPLGTPTPSRSPSRSPSPVAFNAFAAQIAKRSAFVRWAVDPSLSLKLLLLPIVLYLTWELLAPYVKPDVPNPFSPIFMVAGYIPTSTPEDPRYRKTWWDIPFIAYYVVVFSFVRQSLAIHVSQPLASYFGLRRESMVDRFGEQTYALFYFTFFGAWGCRVMTQLPTFWYNTSEFWNGYPFWDMKPELKGYYLIQFAYWWQQLFVLALGLEKPRKDYWEQIVHHLVTVWLVGWSYLVNLTYIGNAVYMNMDIPDAFLAFSKLLNYIQWDTAKLYSLGLYVAVWTYFLHYLNVWILWSVWYEQPNVPEWSKHWSWSEGVYMPEWMQYQIFIPLFLLQCLHLFWYYLMFKLVFRVIMTHNVDDHQSDDKGDVDDVVPDNKVE